MITDESWMNVPHIRPKWKVAGLQLLGQKPTVRARPLEPVELDQAVYSCLRGIHHTSLRMSLEERQVIER
jgi:hypothetical protein